MSTVLAKKQLMRKFPSYQKELTLECFNSGVTLKKGVINNDVKKVQEWLCLNSLIFTNLKSIEIDSDFGKITESAIKDFQAFKKVSVTGVVDESTFFELTKPMRTSFEISNILTNGFRELVCKVAQMHFENLPRELTKKKVSNLGPWVRSYCDGVDGDAYWWCCGFVKSIFDIACDLYKLNFKTFMVNSLACDDVANFAIQNNSLIRNAELRDRIGEIKPGDVFFKYSPDNGTKWHHIGIITSIQKDGIIETIEGNASKDKSGNIGDTSNGTGVFAKRRDLFDKKRLTDDKGNKYWDYYEVYKLNI